MTQTQSDNQFAHEVIKWHLEYGRHDLPWQRPDPYYVWVSEVMLQQTQVTTVLKYFNRFIDRFEDVQALADSPWDDVAALWSGLGYYARARNLHRSAKLIAQNGFPDSVDAWQALPGIGASTAGAIHAMGQGGYGVILDGNVKRVLARYTALQLSINTSKALKTLWQLAEKLTPNDNSGVYAQAMMDLGATLCKRRNPSCTLCPLKQTCKANQLGQQEHFPVKQKNKRIPTKHANALIIYVKTTKSFHISQTPWLWLKRPLNGLWGGLWTLPLLSDSQLASLQERLKLPTDDKAWTTLPAIKHTFSHFHWMLTPVIFPLDLAQQKQLEQLLSQSNTTTPDTGLVHDDNAWLTPSALSSKGVPKAMIKIMDALNQHADLF